MNFLPKNQLNKRKLNSGQALLLVLLVLSVVLTIAMSAVSRSITDISVTTYEDTSSRALTAAEVGVEEAFQSGVSSGNFSGTLPNDASYRVNVDNSISPGTDVTFEYPKRLISGETGTFWFVSHSSDGQLTCDGDINTDDCLRHQNVIDFPRLRFCWGDKTIINNSGIIPALELTIYYDKNLSWLSGDYSNLKVWRKAFDPDSSRRPINGFLDPLPRNCPLGDNYEYYTGNIGGGGGNKRWDQPCQVGGEGCYIMARVRLLYNYDFAHPVAMDTNGPGFPSQGIVVSSTGVSEETTRKISVLKSYPEPPSFLDASLYSTSTGGIVK